MPAYQYKSTETLIETHQGLASLEEDTQDVLSNDSAQESLVNSEGKRERIDLVGWKVFFSESSRWQLG